MIDYIPAKHIITKVKDSSWFGLDYNMNIYRGCCHDCIYCDSRSDCYQIKDFHQVRAKENALMMIRDELRRKVKKGVVGTGSMSDPYNPFEKELNLTRHALELLDAFGFGIGIATKSTLLLRDMDILDSIREHSPVLCKVTVTAIDDTLSKKLEPNAPESSKRLDMISNLSDKGIFTGILLMPVLPFLEDNQEIISGIVKADLEAGAKFIYAFFGMTLRDSQREWYFKELERIFPEEGLLAQYGKTYGNRYECHSLKAKSLWKGFTAECERYGILYNMKDFICAYKRRYENMQLSLFDL